MTRKRATSPRFRAIAPDVALFDRGTGFLGSDDLKSNAQSLNSHKNFSSP
jgi:hypothetical protein